MKLSSGPDDSGSGARIVVAGIVDPSGAALVRRAVGLALDGWSHVLVDVRGVESWGDGAIAGLAECARLGRGVEILMRGTRREHPAAG